MYNSTNPTKKFKKVTAIKLKATETEKEQDVDLSLLPLLRKSSYNDKLLVATGSNYAFAVLEKNGIRHFDEISFFDATYIANRAFKMGNKNIQIAIKTHFEKEHTDSKLLFLLKQNEMVYLPPNGEIAILDSTNSMYEEFWNNKLERSKHVYVVVKFSGKEIYFLKHDIANTLINKVEFGSQNCYQKINDISIKDRCIKIAIDRLGNIKPIV